MEKEKEKTPICKIVCQWIIQIILWISFFIFILSSGYKLKFVVLEKYIHLVRMKTELLIMEQIGQMKN